MAIRPPLFASNVLDESGCYENFRNCHERRYYGADHLWHDNLFFKCRIEIDESIGRCVEIRNTANELLRNFQEKGWHHDLDLAAVLDGLCWLVLECGGKDPYSWRKSEPLSLGLNLLSAATYFGCIPLVRDLLGQGYDPTRGNELFPAPIYLAAWTGQVDTLQLMQEHLPDFEDLDPGNPYGQFRSKIGPWSLLGAAVRGDMDIVRLTLYPPSRTVPPMDNNFTSNNDSIQSDNNNDEEDTEKNGTSSESILILGETPGHVSIHSKLHQYILQGMARTGSPEIYQYLQSFLSQTYLKDHSQTQEDRDHNLARKAEAGDIAMVRHLLELGANPNSKETEGGPPLIHAIRAWHEDIFDLLLEYGADPNHRGQMAPRDTALSAVVKAGSMVMLQKLLDAGYVIVKKDIYSLMYAVKMEHTAMVELLLRLGVGSRTERRRLLQKAQDMGLESMVRVLKLQVAD